MDARTWSPIVGSRLNPSPDRPELGDRREEALRGIANMRVEYHPTAGDLVRFLAATDASVAFARTPQARYWEAWAARQSISPRLVERMISEGFLRPRGTPHIGTEVEYWAPTEKAKTEFPTP